MKARPPFLSLYKLSLSQSNKTHRHAHTVAGEIRSLKVGNGTAMAMTITTENRIEREWSRVRKEKNTEGDFETKV